jgi:hypothetical protein
MDMGQLHPNLFTFLQKFRFLHIVLRGPLYANSPRK